MRRLRNLSIILFVLSLALFGVFQARTISRQDSSGPEISMERERIEVSVEDPEEKLLEGITAYDRRDGDVTSSLLVENVSTFLRPSVRIVTYAAFDKDMHVTRTERELNYTDYKSPEFSITQPLILHPGNTNLLDHVTVSDVLDGSLTDSIKILSDKELLVDTEGDYEIWLQAANSAGDVAKLPVLVHVGDIARNVPQVQLKGYVKYLDIDEEFDPLEMVKGVSINGSIYEVKKGSGTYGKEGLDKSEVPVVGTQQIKVTNPIKSSEPGNYRVRYSMTITNNNGERITGETLLYVVVRESYNELADG